MAGVALTMAAAPGVQQFKQMGAGHFNDVGKLRGGDQSRQQRWPKRGGDGTRTVKGAVRVFGGSGSARKRGPGPNAPCRFMDGFDADCRRNHRPRGTT